MRRRSPARDRLGLAHSRDGVAWQRSDERLGLDVSPGAWDGDSIEYGAEIEAAGRTWLLYNGDDFGATGFGVAELLGPVLALRPAGLRRVPSHGVNRP